MQPLARQESIPVALYTEEKIMDDFIAVGEVKHTIWEMFFKMGYLNSSSAM